MKYYIIIISLLINISCKKENLMNKPITKIGLEDSSNWLITEKIFIYYVDSINYYTIIDSTHETYTHTSIIKKTDNEDQFTISNFEHYYPKPIFNSINGTYDVNHGVYYFKKTNKNIAEYEYSIWIDFITESVNYTTITFNDTIKPTSFKANGGGSFTNLYPYKIFYFTMIGTKL